MDVSAVVRRARLAAGLTQRDLAAVTQIPQPAIARIESGRAIARIETLETLLDGCGMAIAVVPKRGSGVDRSVMRGLLKLTAAERIELAAAEANNLDRFEEAIKS